MSDGPRLREALRALGPAPGARDRARVPSAARTSRPLLREWAGALGARPIANAAWILAAAAMLLATSPLAALASLLGRLARGP